MPPIPQPFSDEEKAELLTIINQIRSMGIKLIAVSLDTGINYKALMNKIKDLELRQKGQESTFKNSFTAKDYKAIKAWWANFKEQIANISNQLD
jgi:hypothetical protein